MANGTETGTVVDQVTEYMDPDKVNQLFEMGKELLIQYGLKALAAIAIFIIGKMIANWLRKLVIRVMKKADIDEIIIGFTSSIAYIGMLAFVVVAALGQLGIQTTSFIAISRCRWPGYRSCPAGISGQFCCWFPDDNFPSFQSRRLRRGCRRIRVSAGDSYLYHNIDNSRQQNHHCAQWQDW